MTFSKNNQSIFILKGFDIIFNDISKLNYN